MTMITIRKELIRDVEAREALLDRCLRRRPLPEDVRAAARGPSAGAGPRLRRVRPRPRRRHRAAVERRPPARHGRRCCSGRSPCTRTTAAAASAARWCERSLGEAKRLGHRAVLLVGDAPYYGRFGFSAEKTGSLWLPGPLRREPLPGARARARRARRRARPRQRRPGGWHPKPAARPTLVARASPQPHCRAARPDPSCLGVTDMNALTRMTESHLLHAQFAGPIVMIGFGSIGRGILPLLERHIGFDRSKFVVIDPVDTDRAAARRARAALRAGRDHQGQLPPGADPAAHRRSRPRHDRQPVGRHLVGRPDGLLQGHRRLLHRHGLRAVARPLHQRQGLDLGALELCAARGRARRAPPPPRRGDRRELLRRQSRAWCPGWSSRRCSTSPRDTGVTVTEPKTREEWARLMQRARRQGHPHRRARHPARARPEAARRVRQHLVGRGLLLRRPAALRARLGHAREADAAERPPPRLRLRRRDLPDPAGRRHARALLDADGAGPARLPGDPQRVDLDRRLLHAARGRQGRLPADLPLRLPPVRRRRAVAARDGAARPGSGSRSGRSSTSTRSSTASTSSACCSTATPRTPTGTARSSRSRRRGELAPYQNATGLQVTSAVLAGIVWMLENPDRGIVEADEMDFRRCLEIQRPYLGPVIGHYTDWTPLDGPRRAVSGGRRHERSLAVQERAGRLSRANLNAARPGQSGGRCKRPPLAALQQRARDTFAARTCRRDETFASNS